jgi:multiple sugar transport system substrate-binding protein
LAFPSLASAEPTTVVYWRHHYGPEITAMEELIERFEAEQPDIRIDLQTFPYNVYTTKVAAALSAGSGPHIVNLHNSWAHGWIQGGRLQPLPQDRFSDAELRARLFPLAASFTADGRWYGIPLGAANLALFYNRRMFAEKDLLPPRTWSELEAAARALTIRDRRGRLLQAGASIGGAEGGAWNFFLEGILRQGGVDILAADETHVLWNTPRGAEALRWYTSFITDLKVNSELFPGTFDAFRLELSAMMVTGSWSLSALARDAPDLDFGTAVLPSSDDGRRATYGTLWSTCATNRAKGAVRDAAMTFLAFLAKYETSRWWSEQTGELPVHQQVLDDSAFRAEHPELEPFLAQMPYSYSSLKKDESVYMDAIIEAIQQVVLRDMDPAEALNRAAETVDAMLGSR